MNLPNRKERRRAAKEMGLLGKKKEISEESKERAKAMGNLIRLRNLTEQRNRKKDNWFIVSNKSFIIPKADKLKSFNQDSCNNFHVIDVNLWFKNNNLTPSSMNEIRQYIFEEWLHKKITSSKTKISTGSKLVIIYDSPTDPFVDLLKHKIIEILDFDFCDIVLVEE